MTAAAIQQQAEILSRPTSERAVEGKPDAAEGSPVDTGKLVRQEHGGAILQGGNWGNKGGKGVIGHGRMVQDIRRQLQADLSEMLPTLAQRHAAGSIDSVEYANFLARYGIGQLKEVSVEAVREKLRDTLEIIRLNVDAETASRIVDQLKAIWT